MSLLGFDTNAVWSILSTLNASLGFDIQIFDTHIPTPILKVLKGQWFKDFVILYLITK